MTAFTLKLKTLATNDPNAGESALLLKPKHKQTLTHAMELRGEFSIEKAEGYALLDYPPCWQLAEFRADRLVRYLRLTRSNLRLAFGKERGDQWMESVKFRRRASR